MLVSGIMIPHAGKNSWSELLTLVGTCSPGAKARILMNRNGMTKGQCPAVRPAHGRFEVSNPAQNGWG
jgi:hypothetical protein